MAHLPRRLGATFLAAALVFFAFAVPSSVQAFVVDLNQCWSSCNNLDIANQNATVATLEVTQSGADVDFVLTNLVGNLGTDFGTSPDTIITQFNFSYSGGDTTLAAIKTDIESTFAGPSSIASPNGVNTGDFTDAGVGFNITIDLPPPPGDPTDPALFTDGEALSWTISGASAIDFLAPLTGETQFAMVHIQRLANGESVKFVDNGPGGGGTPVSEPGTLAVLGVGLAGLGLARRRRRAR
jgi:PEP-CTERM motif